MARFLLVLDVDSTLIDEEAIDLLADEAGSRDAVATVTARAMAGELDFAQSLRERVATLAGLEAAAIPRAAARIHLTRGAESLVQGVHAAEGIVCAVSGGFHELVDPLAQHLGLDRHRANRLEMHAGRATGRTDGPVIDAAAKADTVREWAAEHSIPLTRTVVVGDGANDLDMMAIAGLAIAFDAKPLVRDSAHVSLPERDLSIVLGVLGLR